MVSKGYSADRISALSDGIFSIAMTLLVFNLQLPELADDRDASHFKAAVVAQGPHLISWLLSFAILCRLWITHNRLMADTPKRSREFTGCNFVLLGAVAIIPYPASLLGEFPQQSLSVIVLSLVYAVAALAVMAMGYLTPDRAQEKARKVRMVGAIMLAAALLASLLALWQPLVGIAVWVFYLFGVTPLSHLLVPDKKRTA
jgi:uncharacterized membrane protein